jgi:hypothetical protein
VENQNLVIFLTVENTLQEGDPMKKHDKINLALKSIAKTKVDLSDPREQGKSYFIDSTIRLHGVLSVAYATSRKKGLDPWALLAVLLDAVPDGLTILQTTPAPDKAEIEQIKALLKASVPAPDQEPTPVAPRVTFNGTWIEVKAKKTLKK